MLLDLLEVIFAIEPARRQAASTSGAVSNGSTVRAPPELVSTFRVLVQKMDVLNSRLLSMRR